MAARLPTSESCQSLWTPSQRLKRNWSNFKTCALPILSSGTSTTSWSWRDFANSGFISMTQPLDRELFPYRNLTRGIPEWCWSWNQLGVQERGSQTQPDSIAVGTATGHYWCLDLLRNCRIFLDPCRAGGTRVQPGVCRRNPSSATATLAASSAPGDGDYSSTPGVADATAVALPAPPMKSSWL
jgi:hypothetical protein